MPRVALEKKTTQMILTPFSKTLIEVENEDAESLKHASSIMFTLESVLGVSMTNLFNQLLETSGELENAQGNDQIQP